MPDQATLVADPETPAPQPVADLSAGRRRGRLLALTVVVLVVAVAATVWTRFLATPRWSGEYRVPQVAGVEASLGIRITQVAVVGDGGLVEVLYTVLDPERATTFQSDTKHPPVLYAGGDHDKPVFRAALMKQGHNLRAGQTYFILYENTKGVVSSGGTVEIDTKAGKLADVPVR